MVNETITPTTTDEAFDVTLKNVLRVTKNGDSTLKQKAIDAFTALLAGSAPDAEFVYAPVSE